MFNKMKAMNTTYAVKRIGVKNLFSLYLRSAGGTDRPTAVYEPPRMQHASGSEQHAPYGPAPKQRPRDRRRERRGAKARAAERSEGDARGAEPLGEGNGGERERAFTMH